MKRIVLVVLAFVMILSLAACAGSNKTNGDVGNTDPSQNATDDIQTEGDTNKAPSGTGSEKEQPSERPDANDDNSASEPDDELEDSKILVAYFSATNNTEGVAQKLADGLGADLYEIVPEVAYTDDDLDYNSDCRANREQNDDSARPAISGSVENMDDYDIIFLGYAGGIIGLN